MKSFASKNKITFIAQIYILIQPLLDFLTSLMTRFSDSPLTIGVIFRILFVAFAGFYLLFLYKGPRKKTLALSYIGIGLFGAASILSSTYFNGLNTIFENTKMFFKVFYLLFVILFFFALYIGEKFTISNKTLATVFIIYSGSIFLSVITSTSFVTYNYGAGYCGWFYAGNEVGAIISSLAPIAVIYAIDIRNLVLKLIVFLLVVFSALYIGTKVPFISLICVITLLLVLYIFKYIVSKDSYNLKLISQCVSLLLIIAVVFNLNSPIKQNLINTYSAQLDFSTSEENLNSSDSTNQNSSHTDFKTKLFNTANSLLSNRLIFSKPALIAYDKASITQKLLGMGYNFKTADGEVFIQHIEMDFIAIFINYGILGFLIYIAFIGIFAVICIKKFFKKIKSILYMKNEIMHIYSIIITLFVAFLAGHTLVAPAVSIYLAIVVINLYSMLDNQTSYKDA